MKTMLLMVFFGLLGTIYCENLSNFNNHHSRKIRELQSGIKSCKEATKSGVYQLNDPDVTVYCEMDTIDGGWLVIQQRVDLKLNFTRDWKDYRNGFGIVGKDESFWLGNEAIHQIAKDGDHELLMEWKRKDNREHKFVRYCTFHVAGEEDKYRLTVGRFQYEFAAEYKAEDKLRLHNNAKFSTYDSDNDDWDDNCASGHKSGWWFYDCASSDLNYYAGPWWSGVGGVKTYSRMMIRRK